MRQRHVKAATVENMLLMGVLFEPARINLDPNKKIHLEIGSGKGQFITKLAYDHENELFIALELEIDICYRIAEKKRDLSLDNLIIINCPADTIDLWINEHTIDVIYLNFSDPWPKAKHHKRRLTWPTMLVKYQSILKEEGILQFRTDHLGLFTDTKLYMNGLFDIIEMDMNLQVTPYMTEYEEKKRKLGHIYQLKGKHHHD